MIDDDLCPHGRTKGAVCIPCGEIDDEIKKQPVDRWDETETYEDIVEAHNADDLLRWSLFQQVATTHPPRDDLINSPQHYKVGGYEAIDVIQAKLTPEEFRGYCKGNILKYLMRANYKGKHNQDVGKADWYMERLWLETQDEETPDSASFEG